MGSLSDEPANRDPNSQQAKEIFLLTKSFPAEEKYSLTDQMRRSSRAVIATRGLAALTRSRS